MCPIRLSLILLAAISLESITPIGLPAQSKAWTIERRQAKLMQDINEGQRSGTLTAAESKMLRKKLSSVARKQAKMKAKQNGKLTIADTSKLQARIDKTSTKIKLEKAP